MHSNYTEQARRIVRSFEKFPKENYPDVFSEDDWDAYYFFFQNAFHLKDWIINDPGNKIGSTEMNKFIDESTSLKILQSFVNGIKHFKIKERWNKYTQIDFVFDEFPKIQYGRKDFICLESGEKLLTESGDAVRLESSDEGKIHPKRLAVDILIEWNKFFKKNDFKGYFEIVP